MGDEPGIVGSGFNNADRLPVYLICPVQYGMYKVDSATEELNF